jgi:hypothetical protein
MAFVYSAIARLRGLPASLGVGAVEVGKGLVRIGDASIDVCEGLAAKVHGNRTIEITIVLPALPQLL